MAISVGERFAGYEVAALIGVGGMGEVYRATDPVLKRSVALKVLSESFVGDTNRLARLQREAELLAALNHGNVAHIYGLERSEGTTALVMEFIEGPTLAERIAQGPIPVDEALRIATQIADALEAAHERGIVHRDLKPANIKLRPDGTVKVLDFGVAKALDTRQISGPGPAALTTPAMTEAGFVLGTAAYMSPEQARGKPVDQRTDVWAFGCVLYEMLTGKPAFLGEDVTTTLARVLQAVVDLNALPSEVSGSVRRTLELCFEKDARKRLADMRDVKLGLAGAFAVAAPAPTARPAWRRALPLVATAALTALLVGLGTSLLRPAPQAKNGLVTRFEYELPDGASLPRQQALGIAPGGELFLVDSDNGLYVRKMGDAEAQVITSAGEGLRAEVAVSPTGREVAFVRPDPTATTRSTAPWIQIVKVLIEGGGAPVPLADKVSGIPRGLRWEADGTLLYALPDGIWQVSDHGGTPQRVIESKAGELLASPQRLPGGEWLLLTALKATGNNRWDQADIVIQSLVSGERRVLRSGGFDARYLPSGHIVYASQNALFAAAFDAKSLTLRSETVSVVPAVQTVKAGDRASAYYAVADNGTLVFTPRDSSSTPRRSLVWVDRDGRESPLPLPADNYTMARISPDGAKAVLVVGQPVPVSRPPPRLFLYDFKTENLAQLTFPPDDGGWDDDPVWSRDGGRIFFRVARQNKGTAIYSIPSEGGTPELVGRAEHLVPAPWSVSPDGKTLLAIYGGAPTDLNVGRLLLGESDTIKPLLDTSSEPSFSPNGQWLVEIEFPKGEVTRTEINIRPFPGVTQQRHPVGAGRNPLFSADGTELFLFDGDGLAAAPIRYSPLRIGSPRKLFQGPYFYGFYRTWDVDPRTGRFLMIKVPKEVPQRPKVEVVLNWLDELKQRVPSGN